MGEEKKYSHMEAFCHMQYQCKTCGFVDTFWNSRDGVTPFCVDNACRGCGGGEMCHINWNQDKCEPDYVPNKGQMIFVDMPQAIYEIYIKMRCEEFWENYREEVQKTYHTKENMLKRLLSNRIEKGEPWLVTI